jgi:transcriptional regulator with XRE-family HTH domain
MKAKKKAGRPSKYSTVYGPLLGEFMARAGMIDREIAERMGITEQTLNNWKKAHPEFGKALKKGKEEPDDKVEASLLRSALGFQQDEFIQDRDADGNVLRTHLTKRYIAPNVVAQIFWLKNRRPETWRDKQEIQHLVDDPLEKFAKALGDFNLDSDSGKKR